ncbi:phage portal protein [Phenylobacterium terrae]|uniref:Phage portal protein n=1 Tax=Phenylobacterium terrae TaxID=2665495 RepID=A0ABW4N7E3_9CAUL
MALFGILGNLGETRAAPVNLSDKNARIVLFGGGTKNAAGVTVNRHTAMGIPAFRSAVDFLSDTVAKLPFHTFKETAKGRRRSTKKLYSILHDCVNDDFLTSFEWRKWMMTQVLTTGRALTFIERDATGEVSNLWPIVNPVEVSIGSTGRKVYEETLPNGGKRRYSAAEIFDLVWMPGEDNLGHIDPIVSAASTLGLAIAAEEYASILFRNGGVPHHIVTAPAHGAKSIEQAVGNLKAVMKLIREEERNELVLPEGVDVKTLGLDPDKTQLLELQKFMVVQIARLFRLPPVFLQDLTHGTFTNTEQQDLAFVKHNLTGWLTRIEQQLNAKLFNDSRSKAHFVEMNVDGLLRGDFTTRMTGYATAIQNGIRTPDECRALETLPAMGGNAAKLMIQGATRLLEDAGAEFQGDQTSNQDEDPVEPGGDDSE